MRRKAKAHLGAIAPRKEKNLKRNREILHWDKKYPSQRKEYVVPMCKQSFVIAGLIIGFNISFSKIRRWYHGTVEQLE
jgi:hypothetical protein